MDYASLVHRVRELVWEHVPAGSNVAVVSKGDPALILFDQRSGWHYPQATSGQYLGHHPDSGAAAVAHLESLRERGAEYLVVPTIYGWFLEYYTDLRGHLDRTGELIHRDNACAIYSLTKRALSLAPTSTAGQRQLRDLVGAILPHGTVVVAYGSAHAALAGMADFQTLEPPVTDPERAGELPALAAAIRSAGASYVIFPASVRERTRPADDLVDRCRAAWPIVLDQRHVCAVFALPPVRSVRPGKR